MNPPWILTLGDDLASQSALTGGKGSRLASLHQQGFPVPNALLVTAAAYEAFVRSVPDLGGLIGNLDLPGGREQLVGELSRQPLPDGLAALLREALAIFGYDAVAVRSSSTLEDLAEAAFAGQHETYLNVRGIDAIVEKVRQCFLSLWNERATSYRSQRGFDHRRATMAVVIQRLIPCDTAGVAFSLDPVTGDPKRILIDANHGLGESVVGGETPVDHWVLDRETLKATECVIALKQHKTVATAQGVRNEALENDAASLPCLDQGALEQIARLVMNVERKARFPQDIEWGFANGKLWLLQARAITTLPPRWTRDESAERFPNPMTPLTWEFVSVGFHQSLEWSLKLMGLPPCTGKWFADFDHYIYGNQNLVEMYCRRMPFDLGGLDDLESLVPRLREEFRWVQQLPVDWMRDLDSYLIGIGQATATDIASFDDRELWEHIQSLVRHGSEYFRPNIAISITHGMLCRLLHRLVSLVVPEPEVPAMFQSLLAWGNTKTSQINRELSELAVLIRKEPTLAEAIRGSESKEFLRNDIHIHPDFNRRFERFIVDHGHRETDFDMYQPPWGDAPWVVIDNLRGMLRGEVDGHEAERAAKIAAHQAEQRLLALVPDRWSFFYSEILRLARLYTQIDDLEHYQTTRLNLPLRRAIAHLGERFHQCGLIDDPMDLFFAQVGEITALVTDGDERIPGILRSRKLSYEAACRREPTWNLGEEVSAIETAAEVLQGLPGSPGTAEGIIHHVRGPEDFAGFPEGAILVSRTTNPAWTPLFHVAAAVITESGGPLSHGAVTARELGIPAVMSVHRCLAKLPAGTRVRVDGLRGRVSLVG
ncbi:PEP/pyruvate-binding domain-containing protein [Luteolibacter sp. LG18]|uniref:PEP/pyruvate-binding domain-containing protein n=1 Tax=Luteolibacter sp. LG18 TaxID=2819286 RepID=UPI002B30167A|nr:pyruvate, phosphate dikinase [Luteolibacter sp. LG18]